MNKGYFAIIPANVRYDKRLCGGAKLLYGEITTICNNKDKSFNKKDLESAFSVSSVTLCAWLKDLYCCGYIKTDTEIVKKLKEKKLKGFGYGSKVCQWCGIKTTVLHKHHYPVSKAQGGNKTVNICPNCHNEFHYSELYRLNLSDETFKEMINVRKQYENK